MTEQENREKRIEEMREIVDVVFRGTLHRSIDITDTACRILYDADYRKADEVRKEFVDELLQYKQYVDTEYDGIHEVIEVSDLKFVAEKYGVTI